MYRGKAGKFMLFYKVHYSVFENNIFLINDYSFQVDRFLHTCDYNAFNNNIFDTSNPIPTGTNVGANNIVLSSHSLIFANQSGHSFSYSHNYRLVNGCPGIGAGTDGKDIGIYGGDELYKDGAVPIIPHILKRKIAPRIVKDGKLKLEMIIEAQTK